MRPFCDGYRFAKLPRRFGATVGLYSESRALLTLMDTGHTFAIAAMSDWLLLITVGVFIVATVLLLQTVSFLSLRGWMHRNGKLFDELRRQNDQTGMLQKMVEGRQLCPWLEWLKDAVLADDLSVSPHWTREGILRELEARLESDGRYVVLDRTAVSAPLVGVVITVIAFWTADLSLDSAATTIGKVIIAVRPLFAGVFCGAALALLNQVLLFFATSGLNTLRNTAMQWFDSRIWRDGQQSPNPSGVTSIALSAELSAAFAGHRLLMQSLAATVENTQNALQALDMRDTAEKHGKVASQLEECVKGIQTSVSLVSNSFASIAAPVQTLPKDLAAIQHAAESVRQYGELLGPAVVQTAEALSSAAKRLEQTADRHHASVEGFVRVVDEATGILRSLDIETVAENHRTAAGQLVECTKSIKSSAEVVKESFAGMAAAVTRLPEDLAKVQKAARCASETGEELVLAAKATATTMRKTVQELDHAVSKEFAPAAKQQRLSAEALEQTLEKNATAITKMDACVGQLAERSLGLAVAAKAQQEVTLTLTTLEEKFGGSVVGFHEAMVQLREFVEGLLPVAEANFGGLTKTVERLNQTANTFHQMVSQPQDLNRLLESLREAARVAEEVRHLPDSIEATLKRLQKGLQEFSRNALRNQAADMVELFREVLFEMTERSNV